MKLMRDEKAESILTLRQSTARLAVEAIRKGASATDILIAVNRALDSAGEVSRIRIEFTNSGRHQPIQRLQ
jgi:hypothetical protein